MHCCFVDTYPPNIHLDQDVLKTSFVFVFRKHLVQDEYIHLSHTSSEARRLQDVLFKTNIFVLAIRLQDVFKTFLRRLPKMSSRRLAKTSSGRLQDLLQRYLQDVFKTYHQVKLFLLTGLREILQTQLSTEGFA